MSYCANQPVPPQILMLTKIVIVKTRNKSWSIAMHFVASKVSQLSSKIFQMPSIASSN